MLLNLIAFSKYENINYTQSKTNNNEILKNLKFQIYNYQIQ